MKDVVFKDLWRSDCSAHHKLRTQDLPDCKRKKQCLSAKHINNSNIQGTWNDVIQALRGALVESFIHSDSDPCPDILTLPVRLVLLDKRVAGDEVAGYGSGFHPSTDSTCLSRKTHAHYSSVKTFPLRDKWLYFGWKLYILQKDTRRVITITVGTSSPLKPEYFILGILFNRFIKCFYTFQHTGWFSNYIMVSTAPRVVRVSPEWLSCSSSLKEMYHVSGGQGAAPRQRKAMFPPVSVSLFSLSRGWPAAHEHR